MFFWNFTFAHAVAMIVAFVMLFMELLSIKGGMLCFSQKDMRHLRKKCLTDLLAGHIRSFPMQ